jgi:hypothetical protein
MANRNFEVAPNRARFQFWGKNKQALTMFEKGPELGNNEALQSINAAGDALVDLVKLSAGNTPQVGSRTSVQTTGDLIGFQTTPNQGANTTGEVFGAQFKPRVASGFDAATVNGLGIDSELKGPGAGDLSGDLRGINLYMGATGSGTIGGDIVAMRVRLESAINPTGHAVLFAPVDNEGAQDWDGLIKFDAALGTHGMTTATDKTGNQDLGTIKVILSNGSVAHIPLYAD